MSVVRGRPPAFAGGMWGRSSAHCGSVRSEGYSLRRMLASMPLLSAAILPAPIPTRHFAHGLEPDRVKTLRRVAFDGIRSRRAVAISGRHMTDRQRREGVR